MPIQVKTGEILPAGPHQERKVFNLQTLLAQKSRSSTPLTTVAEYLLHAGVAVKAG